MDLIKSFEISLDITKVVPNVNFHISQNDLNNIELTANLLKNGVPLDVTGLVPRLGILKPSAKTTYQDMTIIDALNGKVKCTMSTQSYIEAGTVEGEIYLYDNVRSKTAVTGSRFLFTVDSAILSDTSIVSQNDWQSINNLSLAIANDKNNYYTKAETTTQINAMGSTIGVTDLIQHTTLKTNKDGNDIYTTVTLKRRDATTYCVSVLSGGTSPSYTTRTETFYLANGVTVDKTNIYTRTYDANGNLVSEVLN